MESKQKSATVRSSTITNRKRLRVDFTRTYADTFSSITHSVRESAVGLYPSLAIWK